MPRILYRQGIGVGRAVVNVLVRDGDEHAAGRQPIESVDKLGTVATFVDVNIAQFRSCRNKERIRMVVHKKEHKAVCAFLDGSFGERCIFVDRI